MIGRLHGIIIEKQAPHLLIEVAGVGYEVQAPMTSFYPLPAVGETATIHTHLSISENAHQLFGFYTLEERQLFRTLIKVNGVGPKMALAILSGITAKEFVQCVMVDDVATLVKVPGVGKKTAERLIIEIKDRLDDWNIDVALPESNSGDASSVVNTSAMTAEAESALIALGYKPADAAKVITMVQKDAPPASSEELIRLALKSLAS